VDGRGIDGTAPEPEPGRVALVDAPACDIVIVVGGILDPDITLFVVVVVVEDGLIVFATPANAALAVGSGSDWAADWIDFEACCSADIIAFTISPTFMFITDSFGGSVSVGKDGGGEDTGALISFHTGNKAGLSSCDLRETSWNPSREQRYHREHTMHVQVVVYEHMRTSVHH